MIKNKWTKNGFIDLYTFLGTLAIILVTGFFYWISEPGHLDLGYYIR